MPTFNNPLADAREAAEAIRGLAHTTQHVENPEVLYPMVGELMAKTRNMSQVLDQLARAHQRHTGRAMTDTGDRDQAASSTSRRLRPCTRLPATSAGRCRALPGPVQPHHH